MNQSATIWVADEDEQILDIILRAFRHQQLPCQVAGFTSSQELLKKLTHSSTPPDLVVVDYDLLPKDSFAFIESLHSGSVGHSLRLVLVSSEVLTTQVAQKLQSFDVYRVTPKPFDFQQWRSLATDLCSEDHLTQ